MIKAMIVQHINEEVVTMDDGSQPTGWNIADIVAELAKFAVEHSTSVGNYRKYLTNPSAAFLAAWVYEHDSNNGFLERLGEVFPDLLLEMCGWRPIDGSSPVRPKKILLGERQYALSTYLDKIASLIRVWRNEPPPSGLPGVTAAHWCDRHPEILQDIQAAMCSRSSCFSPKQIEWTWAELRPGGAAHSKENVKLGLVPTTRFVGQRTWRQAAGTAAHALFGAFLGKKPENLGFCKKCERPFILGKQTTYCSPKCARSYSAVASRDKTTRRKKLKTFRKVAKELAEWLSRQHREGSVWWEGAQKAAEIRTTKGRRSRTIGEYIRTAMTPPGSPERDRLLRSLFNEGDFADSARRCQGFETRKQELEVFLANVLQAENLAMRGKRK
jgi:hypothetical protein